MLKREQKKTIIQKLDHIDEIKMLKKVTGCDKLTCFWLQK